MMVATFALTTFGGLFMVPSSVAAPEPPAAFTHPASDMAKPCQIKLPGGLKATVAERDGQTVAQLTDLASVHESFQSYWSDGHQYLVPESAAADPAAKGGISAYDTTALAERTCGITPASDTASVRSARQDSGQGYSLARLTLNVVGSNGKPADHGTVWLTNLDDNTFVREAVGITGTNGTIHLIVPAGHYAAAMEYIDPADSVQHVTIKPEFTIRDGASLTMDARAATVPIPVPSTPRPADLSTRTLAVYRGDGVNRGPDHGPWFSLTALAGTPALTSLQINPDAGPVTQGKFTVLTAFDFASPAGAAEPYAYHVVKSADRTLKAYPTTVDTASLATVRRSYTAGGTSGAPATLVYRAVPAWANRTGATVMTGFEFMTPGIRRTEYYSAPPDLTWTYLYEESDRQVDLQAPTTTYREGGTVDETLLAGGLHPNGPVGTPGVVTSCGACSDGTSLRFALQAEGDNTPGTQGRLWNYSTNSVSLKRNGELYATGDSDLDQATVTVPAGKARYELTLNSLRDSTPNRLSPTTTTTWTFTANPGHGKAVPETSDCPAGGTDCTALPLLYAYTNTDADLYDQVTPGRHALKLHVERQQYASGGQISGAEVSVSYDEGAHWQRLQVHGDKGDFTADYTVPSDASGHTVSLRLSAWDTTGGRIDQELPSAYLVP
ncbi:hypothetical protein GCM10010121_088220 [Streptomyces brasiliensis]|uniref:Uncharacterized protein n=2 Tax=Streptomyces brasiliensis TaxID=1954 RepID=A0A917P6N5_9ACTN|nr:hypothetical protein GCM10010121_088220 [Streptomyces brasiliensis]